MASGPRPALAGERAGLDERLSGLEEPRCAAAAARSSSTPMARLTGRSCSGMTSPDHKVCGGDPSQTSNLPAASWLGVVVVGARIQF